MSIPTPSPASARRPESVTRWRSAQGFRGTASIELMICLVPVLFAFLVTAQLALLFMGRLIVQHAANRAVRSAIVILDDDPERHGGAIRGSLADASSEAGTSSDDAEQGFPTALLPEMTPPTEAAGGGTDSGSGEPSTGENDKKDWTPSDVAPAYDALGSAPSSITGGDNKGDSASKAGARLSAIRRAAYAPLAVLTPPWSFLSASGFGDAVAMDAIPQIATGLFLYGPAAASITLHRGANDEVPSDEFGKKDRVFVRISFLMPCRVPLASKFICKSGWDLLRSEELEKLDHVNSKLVRDAILATDQRFTILTVQAAGINHGASYYPTEEASNDSTGTTLDSN